MPVPAIETKHRIKTPTMKEVFLGLGIFYLEVALKMAKQYMNDPIALHSCEYSIKAAMAEMAFAKENDT